MENPSKRLYEKFYSDPDWKLVEEMFSKHLEPLMDMTSIDTSQPSENVKAEVIARTKAYNTLVDILNDTNLIEKRAKIEQNWGR